MRRHRTIRNRLLATFCAFAALLAGVYGLIVCVSLSKGEDNIFENQLKAEVEHFLERYRLNPDTPPPRALYIRGYIGTDGMPAFVRKMVADLPEGDYETDPLSPIVGPENYHLAVRELPGNGGMLYLLYDVGNLEVTSKRHSVMAAILVTAFVAVTILGCLLGLFLAKRILTPIQRLAELIRKTGPENLPTDFSRDFTDDEIGLFAQTLEAAMVRLARFVERERRFTRDASHELRTPLTVIRGALELLQHSAAAGQRDVSRPLSRIDRSAKEMEVTIETFLWLAREEAAEDHSFQCEALPVVESVVRHLRPLLDDRAIEVAIRHENAPVLQAPKAVLRIALSNLVRNAICHARGGRITLSVHRRWIEVAGTGAGIPSEALNTVTRPHVRGQASPGFGLGLSIVQRLCDRFHWHLAIESEVERGTTVRLSFQAPVDARG